ncbi:MAG: bifunctional proline dehydrogenase/L-glutamate gamma-semialdehyde dehydrogenase PutA, partial [Pseudomonadota bacterium]
IACARRLLTMADRIYPQFATHNAHTVAAILDLADRENVPRDVFEFQRLHGMGDALHDTVMRDEGTRCRIYAPVGAHRDLLAYLVRRLLENGANSSFVHQIIDERVAPEVIAADPFAVIEAQGADLHPALALPRDLYGRHRINAGGYDLTDPLTLSAIEQGREPFARGTVWSAGARGDVALAQGAVVSIVNPAKHEDEVGRYNAASAAACQAAIARAGEGQRAWADRGVTARGACLRKAAELYEAHAHELLALLAREAGKTLADGVAEIREAVDFLRYYAHEAEAAGTKAGAPRGVIVCISPWNFPLAIFTGQIAAALVTGNAVIAKPAEQTSLIAARAIALLHTAGIDEDALQLVCGEGESVGAALVRVPGIAGVCFTGSTAVAGLINRQLARTSPEAMLIAETGGLNAMVVDSTALPEQAVRDIIASAFQSAGQRCSALRMLYVQADIADDLITMLKGAMATLKVGDPWALSTDVGPVIDAQAMAVIDAHCNAACAQKRVIATAPLDAALNDGGTFCAPTLIEVGGIEDLESEIFGPVLHVARFEADALGQVVRDINAKGYGLTFGLHSRIDRRVQDLVDTVDVGNLYINRNQIGAVVGAQPFGGEGLSGTGPKAGGPHYLARFRHTSDASPTGGEVSDARDDGVAGGADDGLGADARSMPPATAATAMVDANAVDAAFEALTGKAATWARRRDRISALRSLLKGQVGSAMSAAAALDMGPVDLPGPTGESNRLWLDARKRVLCLGPDPSAAAAQAVQALRCGCAVVIALQDHAGVSRLLAGLMEADAGEAGVPLHVMAGENPCAAMVDVAAQATLDAVAYARHDAAFGDLRRALAQRDGPIVPIIDALHAPERYGVERAVCIDTTAAGGNATLLATTA